MASSLSEMLGQGEQRGDGTMGNRLTRAAGRGMREMVKEVVKEAIVESEAESHRSRGGGSGRGLAMLGLGAIAGYLVRDWQLRPEMYEELEEEITELPEEAKEAREEAMEDDEGSRMGGIGRVLGLGVLAVVGFALLRRRRRSQRADQWTEQRDQQGGLSSEMGGDAGRMGEESEGQEQQSTMGGSSESSMGGSSESDEESSE